LETLCSDVYRLLLDANPEGWIYTSTDWRLVPDNGAGKAEARKGGLMGTLWIIVGILVIVYGGAAIVYYRFPQPNVVLRVCFLVGGSGEGRSKAEVLGKRSASLDI
jgi:hypothetical protein